MGKMLVLGATLILIGCNNLPNATSGNRVPMRATNATGRAAAQAAAAAQNAAVTALLAQPGNCLPLKALLDLLKGDAQFAMNIYVTNHQVGTPGKTSGSPLTPLSDASAAEQFLLGAKKPVLLETVGGSDLDSSAIAGDFLNVTAQAADCSNVTFQSGTFTNTGTAAPVKPATPTPIQPSRVVPRVVVPVGGQLTHQIRLTGANNETRTYSEDGANLRIRIDRLVSVSTCADGSPTNVSEVLEIVVAHGNPQNSMTLKTDFAKVLGASLLNSPQSLTNQVKPAAAGAKSAPVSGQVTLDYPDYAMISEAVSKGELQPDALACPKK